MGLSGRLFKLPPYFFTRLPCADPPDMDRPHDSDMNLEATACRRTAPTRAERIRRGGEDVL
jgi:hypothetical protein